MITINDTGLSIKKLIRHLNKTNYLVQKGFSFKLSSSPRTNYDYQTWSRRSVRNVYTLKIYKDGEQIELLTTIRKVNDKEYITNIEVMIQDLNDFFKTNKLDIKIVSNKRKKVRKILNDLK